MAVRYAGPTRLLDGTIDKNSLISPGNLAVVGEGLKPSTKFVLVVTKVNGPSQSFSLVTDSKGSLDALLTITDPDVLAVYDGLGAGEWSRDTGIGPWLAGNDKATITLMMPDTVTKDQAWTNYIGSKNFAALKTSTQEVVDVVRP